MSRFKISLRGAAVVAAAFMSLGTAQAQSGSQVVSGLTSIYGANTAGAINFDNSGIRPTAINLTAGTNRILTFSSVTGTTTPGGGIFLGPDGGNYSNNGTNIESFNGISGTIDEVNNTHMALYGFFGNGTFSGTGTAAAAPARLDFTSNHNFTSLSPLINQSFYIGDGLTGTGTGSVQQFLVPDSATVLYLGFQDAYATTSIPFRGQASAYNDNGGSLTATYSITGTATAPEPGTFTLLGVGMVAGAGLLRRRCRTTAQ
jgi:hypothetical protein